MDPPQWGLDAAKTPTPAYVKDAASVVLYDEYLETVDAQGRAKDCQARPAGRLPHALALLLAQAGGEGFGQDVGLQDGHGAKGIETAP